MRKHSLAVAISLSLAASVALAENILRLSAPITKGSVQTWSPGATQYSPWANTNFNCGQWSPSPATYTESALFDQMQACTVEQSRTGQKTLVSNTGTIKPDGDVFTETQTQQTQNARQYQITTTAWAEQGFTCTLWSPDPSTIAKDTAFTQTANDCVVTQSRTRSESYKSPSDATFVAAGTMTETKQLTGQSKSRESVGTMETPSNYMKVLNAVPGVNGIYTIDAGSQGTFNAYVDMTTDGGYWILVANWTAALPNAASGRTHKQINVKGQPISGYTSNPTTYPIIKDGIINTSSYGLFKHGNTTWKNTYGDWQVMETVDSTFVYGINGFPVRTSTGATKTMWHKGAGWTSTESAMITDYFGFNMRWGNSGPCGGSGNKGSNVCPYLYTSYPYHFDFSTNKQFYLKASLIE